MRILSSIPPWLLVLALVILVVNVSPCNVKPITPAVLLYALQDSPLPILFSPFLVQSWTAGIARVLQLTWIATQPRSARLTLGYFIQLYPAVLAARAGTGFIFGRAVGWKYPHLFSHDAVYEPIAGFGPILLGSLLFDDALGHDKRSTLIRGILSLVFVVLDGMPWGYMCGAALVGLHRLTYAILYEGRSTHLPRHIHTSPERPRTPDHNHPPLSPKRIFLTSILAIPALGLTGTIPALIQDLTRAPAQPRQVHIVMLTVPRTRDLSSDVMIDSIQSYITPWQNHTPQNLSLASSPSPSSSSSYSSLLTVFAHLGPDRTHPAFDRARAFFHTSLSSSPSSPFSPNSGGGGLELNFHLEPPPNDTDEPVMNHYAHLADAVRYARRVGVEWTMFVEDDFVLCGEWGWEGLMRVLERLEESEEGRMMNGAFVGTGGRYVHSMFQTCCVVTT